MMALGRVLGPPLSGSRLTNLRSISQKGKLRLRMVKQLVQDHRVGSKTRSLVTGLGSHRRSWSCFSWGVWRYS